MENTVSRIVRELFEKHKGCSEGAVADYIPELTKADPNWFGISIVTADGKGYHIGDTDQRFTIQSISKAFTYGMILDAHGWDFVENRIGVEPSGEAFNSISLDPRTGRPLNPMINAGAIAATGMVKGDGFDERFEKIRKRFSDYAGAELSVDEEVYRSESATGFRNRAIANLLRNFEILEDPVDESVEVYFKQCSILVTCQQLAMMGASLANGGVNPVSGEQVLQPSHVEKVLSVMSTCGMYDATGEWIFEVGLPAKSGVGGGILGVLPGQLAVAVFSPNLDPKGNSVRGLRVFQDLSSDFNLHLFNFPVITGQVIRRVYKMSTVGSHRQRMKPQREAIAEHGDSITVVEMQGDFFFSAMERLLRIQDEHFEGTSTFVYVFKRVSLVDHATQNLLVRVARDLAKHGKRLLIVDPRNVLEHERFTAEGMDVTVFRDIGDALEKCEDEIIAEHAPAPSIGSLVPFHEFELFEGMSSSELSHIEGLLEMDHFEADKRIVKQGAKPKNIFLLAKGSVSVYHGADENGDTTTPHRRIISFCPGVCFGDLGIVDGAKRSANVIAVEDSTCYTLSLENMKMLEAKALPIYTKIVRNILKINVDRLRRSNQEITTLKY